MRSEATVAHYSIPNFDEFGGANVEPSDSIESGKLRVVGGELLVSRLNPRKQRVLVTAQHDELAVCSGEFVVLRALSGVLLRFLYWRLLAEDTRQHLAARVRSVTRSQQRVDPEEIRKLWIDLPSLDVQQRISDFLDSETARVDDLIAEQEATRRLLDERIWSLFTERVLGADATVVPLRRVLTRLSDGPFGSAFTSGDYSDDGAAVVRLGNIGFAEYRSSDQAFIPLGLYERFARHKVGPGDLLIAGLGDARNHAGRACVAPDLGPAIVKGKCFVAAANPALTSAEFLALFLSSALGRDAVGEAARGSTRTMINLDITKSSLLLLPALADQARIVEEVAEARSRLTDLISEIDRQLAFLLEHRQALITAAVTRGLEALQGVA